MKACVEIPLYYRGKLGKYTAVVDKADFPATRGYRWIAMISCGKPYAITWLPQDEQKPSALGMHRLLTGLNFNDGKVVVFKDGDSLNCRRANMIVCRRGEAQSHCRQYGSSKWPYKGIEGLEGRYRARLRVKGKRLSSGYYATPEEAAREYNRLATIHFGQLAWLNEIKGAVSETPSHE